MKQLRHSVAIVALALVAFVVLSPTVHAASPAQVTLTFRLTLSGTVPSNNIFLLTFPSNGSQFCSPCAGGHTYVLKLPWAKGTAVVPFRLDRENVAGCAPLDPGSASCPPQNQHHFARFDVSPTADQTFNAAFAFSNGSAAPPVPASGADADLFAAAALIAFGIGTVAFATWAGRRRRARSC